MNPKVINSLNARLARIEALLENQDTFGSGGGTTYGGLNYQGSEFNLSLPESSFGPAMIPEAMQLQMQNWLQEQLEQNYGFGANDQTIAELQQRIAELELLVAGGSNDTNQSDALDAGAAVGDDASDGTGQPAGSGNGIPAGFTEVEISICDGGTAKTMTVIGTIPV
jgi:hypothetical protein